MAKIDLTKLSSMEIAQMFSDYVGRMEDQERHTKAACKEVDAFDTCCSSEFPNNVRVQNIMYEKMMNVAIEFEESGFIAGFKTAIALFTGDDGFLPAPTGTDEMKGVGKAQEQVSKSYTNNSSFKEEKGRNEAVTTPQGSSECQIEPAKYIDTTQIGRMFGRTNFKTVRGIKNSILPFISEEERKNFIFSTKQDRLKKEQIIIKLTLAGCKIYLEYCQNYMKYANFVSGVEKLKEEMEKVWCSSCQVA